MSNPHKITCFEHQSLKVGEEGFSKKHLAALLKLNEVNNFSYFDAIANGIKFKQYVGIIQVNNLAIEILPKADKYDDDAPWQNLLINMLKACGKPKADSTGPANVNRHRLNLLEVYFLSYLNEIEELSRKGLVKQYRTNTANVRALKGKLEFAGHLKKNLVNKQNFYTTHQVYDTDHFLHQVLSKALEIVEVFTRSTSLYDKCKRVQLAFPDVKQIHITKAKLDKIKLNRKTKPYAKALELARLIILNYSPDISAGKEKMLSLLFDMNKLWEDYVAVVLKKYVYHNKTGYSISAQSSMAFWGNNSLRPDIVITSPTGENIILDTKWKEYNNRNSIVDLRQMFAYNKFWQANKAVLLYPGSFQNPSFKPFEDSHTTYCKSATVSILSQNSSILNPNLASNIWQILELN